MLGRLWRRKFRLRWVVVCCGVGLGSDVERGVGFGSVFGIFEGFNVVDSRGDSVGLSVGSVE